MGDYIKTKKIKVEIQENGIIRDYNGYIIGHLNVDIKFDELKEYKPEELPQLPPCFTSNGYKQSLCIGVDGENYECETCGLWEGAITNGLRK